jgi:hypothetical protein
VRDSLPLRCALFKEETVKRYLPLVLLALLAFVAVQAGATNLIQNGSFQSNDFTDWTIGTTSNGTWGSGFPIVSGWPLGGGLNAAQGQVGEVNFDATQQGGTLTQTFQSTGGAATETLLWAAMGSGNADGGEFTMILNGTQIAQFDTGNINGMLNGSLSASAPTIAGTNTLEIEVTRRFISTGGTPFQWVTGVDVEGNGVPEPGSLVLMGSGVLGLAGVLRRKIGF